VEGSAVRGPVDGATNVVRFPVVAFAEVGKVLRTPGDLADSVFVVAGDSFPTDDQRGSARRKWVSTWAAASRVVFSLVERGGKLISKNIELGFAGEVGGSGGVVLMAFHPLEFDGHWEEF
jgi:hypothetical protein